ncbi:hypothetical protein OXX69_008333 [Metschnikowia pulcherrima]
MKFAPVAILFSALAAASPVYHVEWVTVTQYTTIVAGHDEYTSAFPQTTKTVLSAETPAASQELSTETYSEVKIGSEPATEATTEATTEPITSTTVPTTTIEPTTTTPSTTSSTAASSASGEVFSGDGTYYDTGLGACGWTNTDTDYIAAIGHGLFDEYTPNGNPNRNTLCGKKIIAHYEGKSVEVTAVDRCEGCSPYDLDFSPAAFDQLADASLGRIQITWSWA